MTLFIFVTVLFLLLAVCTCRAYYDFNQAKAGKWEGCLVGFYTATWLSCIVQAVTVMV